MSCMPRVEPGGLPGMWLITPPRHDDARGYFAELYRADLYRRAGVPVEFVQANQSSSRPGVLRGLHYQLRHPQDKLIAVSRGCIWDVAVDLRWGSPTFGQWAAHELSAENRRQVFVPAGFAHGFCVLGEEPADVIYFCSRFYDPTDEYGVRWDDPRLRIPWPVARPLVSPKDAHLPSLADLPADDLPAL